MDNLWILYWVTRFDDIRLLFLLVTSACTVGLFVSLVCSGETWKSDDYRHKCKINAKKFAACTFASLLIAFLVPTSNDVKFILAGVAITEVAQSDSAKRIASKSVAVIESYLDKQLKTEGEKK